MKRVVIISLVCVLAFFQYSWGYQAESQQSSEGLVEVLTDIITAPCSLLAVCLGMESGAPCTYPQKQRLTCVPVKKPCRPPRTSTTIRKVPSRTKPPKAQLPSPGVSQRPPGLPPQTPPSAPPVSTRKEVPPTQTPAPPVTTRKEVPPQREALPGPPTVRPRLPDILPGPSEPMPEPGTPKRPITPEGQRTTVPEQPSLGKTPGRVPVPPTPGISRPPSPSPVAPTPEVSKTPTTPKTEKSEKQPKPGKSRQWAPCGPVYPSAPCMPVRPPVPCGPQLFFR
jgi:hypothetical protein